MGVGNLIPAKNNEYDLQFLEKLDKKSADKTHKTKTHKSKAKYRSLEQKLSLFVAVILCFVMGITLVFYYAQVAYLGYKINLLQEEITSLRLESFALEQEVAKATSLAQIERIAVGKLGMVKPDSEDTIILHADFFHHLRFKPEENKGSEKNVESTDVLTEKEENNNKIVQAFIELLEY